MLGHHLRVVLNPGISQLLDMGLPRHNLGRSIFLRPKRMLNEGTQLGAINLHSQLLKELINFKYVSSCQEVTISSSFSNFVFLLFYSLIFLLLLLEEIHTAHSNIHMSSYIQIHIHIQQASNKGKEKLCFFPFHFNRQFFFSILSQF